MILEAIWEVCNSDTYESFTRNKERFRAHFLCVVSMLCHPHQCKQEAVDTWVKVGSFYRKHAHPSFYLRILLVGEQKSHDQTPDHIGFKVHHRHHLHTHNKLTQQQHATLTSEGYLPTLWLSLPSE